MSIDQPIPFLAASPEPWSHQHAFASLKAHAKHFAGLENARMLILQSRQIRYLRYVQIEQQATEERAEGERIESAGAENPILEQAA